MTVFNNSLHIWYDILFHINKTNKHIQSSDITIGVLHAEEPATMAFFEQYCNTGYNPAILNASEIAD